MSDDALVNLWNVCLRQLDAQSHKDDIWYAAAIKEIKTDEVSHMYPAPWFSSEVAPSTRHTYELCSPCVETSVLLASLRSHNIQHLHVVGASPDSPRSHTKEVLSSAPLLQAGVVTYTVKFANFSEKHNEKFQPHLHASRLMPLRAYTGKIRAIQMLKKAPVRSTTPRPWYPIVIDVFRPLYPRVPA